MLLGWFFWLVLFLIAGRAAALAEAAPEDGAGTGLCRVEAATTITRLHGYTRARHVRLLTAEESGRCLEVTAELGEAISAAGIFARIDPVFIELELEINRAASRRLENFAAYWRHEVERFQRLKKARAVPGQRVEEFVQKFDQARLQLAEIEVRRKTLEERLRRCRIPAPAGWRVLERRVEPGEWLVPGRVVGRVGDYRTLKVPFSLTAEQFAWLERRPAAELFLERGDERGKVPARLLHVSPAFDPRSRKILVEFEVDGELVGRRGGIGLDLLVELPEPGGVVLVPESSFSERYDAGWVVLADGREVKVVKLGRMADGRLRVSGDLQPGMLVRCRKPVQRSLVR
jgi:RND family efflux transporter MFP subunit